MTQATYSLVREFIASMTAEDWQRLSRFGLHGLKFLHSVPLDFTFLKAAAHFWDPCDHVFRFQSQEICPLPEEFAAILGVSFPSAAQIVLPNLSPDYATQLKQVFMLTRREVSSFLSAPHHVPISRLLELANRCERSSPSWSRLAALVLLSQFLLTTLEGYGDCALLSVVEGMEQGMNPFLTILAETVRGLDGVSLRTSNRMCGSPLLLQIWLQEKLGLLSSPSIPSAKYKPKHHKGRSLLRPASTFDEWVALLHTIPDSTIRWMCPWWNISHVTLETYASCVPVAGLHESSFYAPSRLCRQYGEKQRKVARLPSFQGGPNTPRFLFNLQEVWSRRRISFNISSPGDNQTDDDYRAWVGQNRSDGHGTSSSPRSKRIRNLSVSFNKMMYPR